MQQFDEEPAHHVHGGADVVRVQVGADVGLTDVLQGEQVIVVVPAGKKRQEPVGVDFLEFVKHQVVAQKLGRLGNLQQVVVKLLHHAVAVVLRYGEQILEQPRVLIGEEIVAFNFFHGKHDSP